MALLSLFTVAMTDTRSVGREPPPFVWLLYRLDSLLPTKPGACQSTDGSKDAFCCWSHE